MPLLATCAGGAALQHGKPGCAGSRRGAVSAGLSGAGPRLASHPRIGHKRAMITFSGLILGILFGIWRARRLNGDRGDMVQYAAVFGLIFMVAGVILSVAVLRVG